MRKGLITSSILHAALLIAGIFSFPSSRQHEDLLKVTDVDVLTGEEFDLLFSAAPSSPKVDVPEPVAPDVTRNMPPQKPVRPTIDSASVDDTPPPEPIKTAVADLVPPVVKKEPDVQPEQEPEAKEETQAPEKLAVPLDKPEQVKPKPEPKKEEPVKPKKSEPKKPAPKVKKEQPKPEPKKEEAKEKEDDFLKKLNTALDKPASSSRSKQSDAPSASTGSRAPVVGPPLTFAEKDGLQFAIKECWSVPTGTVDAEKLVVTVSVMLNKNGTVNGQPALVSPKNTSNPGFKRAFESARRAILRCAPYSMPAEKYGQWQKLEITFNPESMVIR